MVPCEKILDTAREKQVDMIGLSGLITPSLDEMVHVAKEMEREGFQLPLLIGGATTSKVHTAVKIEANYHGPTVHVLDASRCVGVVGSLLSPERREPFAREVKEEYVRIRASHAGREVQARLLPIEEARKHRFDERHGGTAGRREAPVPQKLGITEFSDYSLDELSHYIDWSPFFATWELKGHYPAI